MHSDGKGVGKGEGDRLEFIVKKKHCLVITSLTDNLTKYLSIITAWIGIKAETKKAQISERICFCQ